MQIYTGWLGKFATRGSGKGQLDKPHGLTTDLNGFIIVADTGNCRLFFYLLLINKTHWGITLM